MNNYSVRGRAGYEMIITNSALRASLVYIISYPARPRRIIEELQHATFLSHGRQPEVRCFRI